MTDEQNEQDKFEQIICPSIHSAGITWKIKRERVWKTGENKANASGNLLNYGHRVNFAVDRPDD